MIKKLLWTMGGLFTFFVVMNLVDPERNFLLTRLSVFANIVAMTLIFTLPFAIIMTVWKERAVRRGSPPTSKKFEWAIFIFFLFVGVVGAVALFGLAMS